MTTYQQIDGERQILDNSIPASKMQTGVLPDYTRLTASVATTSLAQFAEWSGVVEFTGALAAKLLRITTSQACRVRLYANTTYRDADQARAVGALPTGDHGLWLEYVSTAGTLEALLSPIVDAASFSGTDEMAILVQNLDAATAVVDVDLLYNITEE